MIVDIQIWIVAPHRWEEANLYYIILWHFKADCIESQPHSGTVTIFDISERYALPIMNPPLPLVERWSYGWIGWDFSLGLQMLANFFILHEVKKVEISYGL